MDPFTMALDALFNAPGSMAAVYTPVGGVPTAVRTIRSQPYATARFGEGELIQATNLFLLRRTETVRGVPVSIEPDEGDLIVVEAGTFAITSDVRLDLEGLSWSCGAEPVQG